MENQIELPPGFRFHPTDEELITHYLHPKVYNNSFSAIPIGKVDLNKVEPWDLPWSAKMGEDEWYFFCVKDKKYPTGSRTNRATEAGYWKATGKDKEIFQAKKLIGMKKTLVFYKGRAPRGQKTNWVMHEFRLEGFNFPKTSKEWVISRIFHKNSSGKKTHISKLSRTYGDVKSKHSNLPPLLEIPTKSIADTSHVTCFSGQFQERKPQGEELFESFNPSSSSTKPPPSLPTQISFDSFLMQDQSILGLLTENNGEEIKQSSKTEFSHDTGGMSTDLSSNQEHQYAITSAGPQLDLDCLWNY